jgi:hypothetical protein
MKKGNKVISQIAKTGKLKTRQVRNLKAELTKLNTLRSDLKEFRGMVQDELYLNSLNDGQTSDIFKALNLAIAALAKSSVEVESYIDDVENETAYENQEG